MTYLFMAGCILEEEKELTARGVRVLLLKQPALRSTRAEGKLVDLE
jgi:hypothetical protein